MAYDEAFVKECVERLKKARIRLLASNGFYGMLLSHVPFALDESCETACTDGEKIYFGPEFMKELSDSELEFVLMHEVMHIVLMHCQRQDNREPQVFNVAADIVVNSNIMHSKNDDPLSITLRKYGESMHVAPNGGEGYHYTAEEVYEMISSKLQKAGINPSGSSKSGGSGSDDESAGGNSKGKSKGTGSDDGGGKEKDSGGSSAAGKKGQKTGGFAKGFFDNHSKWGTVDKDKQDQLRDKWIKHLEDAVGIISIIEGSNQCGSVPLCAQRLLKELKKAQTDWRTLLANFIQEEINDYSFSPPDRRFSESDFFLPDYNEKDESVKNVLFMIDTSGSMSDEMITQAYSEIKGAIDQFNGHLEGWLGFFDAVVVEPKPFSTIDELEIIRPEGGGGTNFHIIFEHVKDKMEEPPSSIVILTDGYAPFPQEEDANEVPVLWIINNEDVTPPWGKTARIKIE